MKKSVRLLAMMFLFVSIANSSFAISASTESTGRSIGDIIPFILGAILIICVLCIAYKMDSSSENSQKIKKSKKIETEEDTIEPVELSEEEEAEIYAEENRADLPYEEDENEYYENDNNFDYDDILNDETEYEEDDISLFSVENDQESSFDNIDDNFSLKEPQNQKQDVENFMKELNKYKEQADRDNDGFAGFTTKTTTKSKKKEPKEPKATDEKDEGKKIRKKSTKIKEDATSEQMDISFLEQMEQNLKKHQEERMRKSGIVEDTVEEEKPKKRGRKPKE